MDDTGDGREPGEPEALKFTLNVTTTDGAAAERQVVHMGDVPDEKRAQLESSCANARTHLRANVELDVMGDAKFLENLMRSSVGKERANGVDSYTAVFYDPKLSGEPTHRPNIRTAPLRAECGQNIKKVIARCATEPDTLPVGDAYFLFDNGKSGNYPELMKPFAGMEKTVKQYVVYKEEMSVHKRFKRVQGCATLQLHETLHIVTGQVFAVPTKSFQDYHGSTAGSMIGPVVMPNTEQLWCLAWKLKKELYGTGNLVPVGGSIGKEIADFSGGPRANDQVEPVFHHSYPVSFYLEILQAFPIANVIDLTPGEGALAFAAHQRNITYWGLTFTETHLKHLRERLDVLCLQCMLEEGHPFTTPWRSPR